METIVGRGCEGNIKNASVGWETKKLSWQSFGKNEAIMEQLDLMGDSDKDRTEIMCALNMGGIKTMWGLDKCGIKTHALKKGVFKTRGVFDYTVRMGQSLDGSNMDGYFQLALKQLAMQWCS